MVLYDLTTSYHSKTHPHSTLCSTSSASSTTNTDIFRLLDPSYASKSASCSYPTAYVDHDGQVHDPDYQQFPSSPAPQLRHKEQRRWRSDYIDEEDLDDDEDNLDALEDDAVYYSSHSHRRSSSFTRHSHRHHTHRCHSPLTIPPLSSSPSPSSINSIESWLSGGDDRDDTVQPEHHPGVLRKKRLSSKFSPSPFSSPELPELRVEESSPIQEMHIRPASPSEALKKEWHAISLSFSISMFRMKRRVKKAIARA